MPPRPPRRRPSAVGRPVGSPAAEASLWPLHGDAFGFVHSRSPRDRRPPAVAKAMAVPKLAVGAHRTLVSASAGGGVQCSVLLSVEVKAREARGERELLGSRGGLFSKG